MKNMTNKELTLLAKDLKMAKILVLNKHGFTAEEISIAMDIPETIVKKLIDSAKVETN